MEIILAKSAGFCFGVRRAVDTCYELCSPRPIPPLPKGGCQLADRGDLKKIYTYGKIIHNDTVVDDLSRLGVVPIDVSQTPPVGVADIPLSEGDKASLLREVARSAGGSDLPTNSTIIVRAHGIAPQELAELTNRGNEIIDTTCPFVTKIHKIVSEDYKLGRQIVIVGDATHPEVIGINGHCDNTAWIVGDLNSLCEFRFNEGPGNVPAAGSADSNDGLQVSIVSQTTFRPDLYYKIVKNFKKLFTDVKFYDTICSATIERQTEAAEIGKDSDICIVIGGLDSSNTAKLYEVCKAQCEHTYLIQRATELDKIKKLINKNTKVGITAGASTPAAIIEEVVNEMEEMNMNVDNFAAALEETLKPLTSGDIVKGMVIGITPTEVQVDLGGKSDGIIPMGEMSDEPEFNVHDMIKVGDEIEVFVVRVSDVEGIIGLSKKKIDSIKGFKEVLAAQETKEILKGRVVEIVSAGVIVLCKGAQVFIPASQASDRFIEDLGVLLNEEVSFRVIDVAERRGKKRVVGSIKAVARETRAAASEAFWATAEVGKKYSGKVKSLTDFGAFVDIGGIDGLVHVSELSWQRVAKPSDVLSIGDAVEVYIKSLDREKSKISLGYKKMEDNPWVIAAAKINEGDVITCKIVRIVPFGAFAEVLPHVDGLIHISQISWTRINKPSDELSVGQEVQAKVLSINTETQQISLSIKELLEQPIFEAPPKADAEPAEDAEPTSYTEESSFTIGDSLDMIED